MKKQLLDRKEYYKTLTEKHATGIIKIQNHEDGVDFSRV